MAVLRRTAIRDRFATLATNALSSARTKTGEAIEKYTEDVSLVDLRDRVAEIKTYLDNAVQLAGESAQNS